MQFWLDTATDSTPSRTESASPYDLFGSACSSCPARPLALAAGNHSVSIKVTLSDGTVSDVFTAQFTYKPYVFVYPQLTVVPSITLGPTSKLAAGAMHTAVIAGDQAAHAFGYNVSQAWSVQTGCIEHNAISSNVTELNEMHLPDA